MAVPVRVAGERVVAALTVSGSRSVTSGETGRENGRILLAASAEICEALLCSIRSESALRTI